MKRFALFCGICFTAFGWLNAQGSKPLPKVSKGRMVRWEQMTDKAGKLKPRNIDIWLPEAYDVNPKQKFQVLYMHDGQNLFDTALAYGHQEWKVDETISELVAQGSIDPVIVVGIWNTKDRYREYYPNAAYPYLNDTLSERLKKEFGGEPLAEDYLKFVVKEVKKKVDATFRTKSGRAHTFMAGSSMGGIISLYASVRYPGVFKGVACMSTHWPISLKIPNNQLTVAYRNAVFEYVPQRGTKWYFDYGTVGLDSLYEIHQIRFDNQLKKVNPAGLRSITVKYNGADHNEASWAARFSSPVLYLMRKE